MNRLSRIPSRAVIGGVAAGVADYFRIDVTIVRLIFVLGFFLTHGPFGVIYLILWIALPVNPQLADNFNSESSNSPAVPPFTLNTKFWGILLIVVGGMALLNQFTWWFNWHRFWPILLVGLGVYLIFKDRLPLDRQPQNFTDNQPPKIRYETTSRQPDYGRDSNRSWVYRPWQSIRLVFDSFPRHRPTLALRPNRLRRVLPVPRSFRPSPRSTPKSLLTWLNAT